MVPLEECRLVFDYQKTKKLMLQAKQVTWSVAYINNPYQKLFLKNALSYVRLYQRYMNLK